MKKFKTKEAALASRNFNPENLVITGCPEEHLEAAKAFITLCVGHDAVNPEFKIDYTDYNQDKFNSVHEMGSPSGVGFAYAVYVYWTSGSDVGARLSSESREAEKHVEKLFHEDYKKMKVYDRKIN